MPSISSTSTSTFNPLPSLFLNSTSNSHNPSSSDLFSGPDRFSLTKPLIIQLLSDLRIKHENNALKEHEALRAEITKLCVENHDLRNVNDRLQNKLTSLMLSTATKFQQVVAENTVRERDTLEDKVAFIKGALVNFGGTMKELFRENGRDVVQQWAESTIEVIMVICDDTLRISNGDDVVGMMLGEIEFAESANGVDMEVRGRIAKIAEEYDEYSPYERNIDGYDLEKEKKVHQQLLTSANVIKYDNPKRCSEDLEDVNEYPAPEFRGVILHDLPQHTTITALTNLIRGGKVESLTISKTKKGFLDAEIFFWNKTDALTYAQFLNHMQLIIDNNLISAELLEINPVEPEWRAVIDREGASRAIKIRDFSTDPGRFGVFTRHLTHCFQQPGIAQWEIESFANVEGGLVIRFASISVAKAVKDMLAELGYCSVYDRDPCMVRWEN
ncbi:hypothetical protein RUND412_004156 [Rhizina undulata]